MSSLLGYLACPYTALTASMSKEEAKAVMLSRHNRATAVAAYMFSKGLFIYSPITSGPPLEKYLSEKDVNDWRKWMDVCHTILAKCDVIYILRLEAWDKSDGVREEITAGDEQWKPSFYVDPVFDEQGNVLRLDISERDI